MELLNILLYIIIFYIFYSWYIKLKFINKNQLKGPFPFPIFGSYLGRLPFIDLFQLSKKYGDIYRIWIGDFYMVIISDVQLIKEVFVKNSENVADRPKFPAMKYLSNYHGIATSSGEYWKLNRDIVSKSLTKIHTKQLYELVELKIAQDISKFKELEKSGESLDIRTDLIKFTTSLMFKYIFNQDNLDYDDPSIQNDIIIPTHEIFKKFGAVNIFDCIKIARPFYELKLRFFEPSGYKCSNYINQKLDQHLLTINDHKDEPRDLMDMLINGFGEKDKHSIISTCKEMIFGGIDTTATAIFHCVMVSCVYPEIQDKVYIELKSNENIIKNNRVSLSDKTSLPYTDAFIKECIRFLPVSAFPLPRESIQDFLLNGKYFIPKGSQILINYYTFYNNEKYFENPHLFDPSRFLNPNSVASQVINIGPFNIGPRSCVAKQFAKDNLFLYITNLILNFKLVSDPNNKANLSIQNFEYGLTLKYKNSFKVIFNNR